MIVLTNVSKSYGPAHALYPTSFTVDSERCLALVGSSGSGKSTLLRLILGLIAPDSGSISIAGEPMEPGRAQALRLRMSYVIQDGGLFPHLTARDNVTLVARLGGDLSPARLKERVAELAEIVRLDDARLDRHPRQLSGGERQRVGLMRALVLDPTLLLLDEPLGALDPIVRAGLQEDLKNVFEKLGKSVLVVTHDMAEAAYLAGTIAVMRDGAVLQHGTMKELVETPAHPFVAEFLGAQRSLTEALR